MSSMGTLLSCGADTQRRHVCSLACGPSTSARAREGARSTHSCPHSYAHTPYSAVRAAERVPLRRIEGSTSTRRSSSLAEAVGFLAFSPRSTASPPFSSFRSCDAAVDAMPMWLLAEAASAMSTRARACIGEGGAASMHAGARTSTPTHMHTRTHARRQQTCTRLSVHHLARRCCS